MFIFHHSIPLARNTIFAKWTKFQIEHGSFVFIVLKREVWQTYSSWYSFSLDISEPLYHYGYFFKKNSIVFLLNISFPWKMFPLGFPQLVPWYLWPKHFSKCEKTMFAGNAKRGYKEFVGLSWINTLSCIEVNLCSLKPKWDIERNEKMGKEHST